MGDKGDKNAARPSEGSLVETRCLIKGPKFAIVPFAEPRSVYLSLPPTRHDLTQGQKARRPIKVGIKGRGGRERAETRTLLVLCCLSAHLVQCEPDEASSFTNPNVGPGTYAS